MTGPDGYRKILGADEDISSFVFTDLYPGTWILEETRSPSSHTILEEPITIVLSEDGKIVSINGDDTITIPELTIDPNENNKIMLKVSNKAKNPLPQTGGNGIYGYFMFGGLMLVSLWYKVSYDKKNRKGAM